MFEEIGIKLPKTEDNKEDIVLDKKKLEDNQTNQGSCSSC